MSYIHLPLYWLSIRLNLSNNRSTQLDSNVYWLYPWSGSSSDIEVGREDMTWVCELVSDVHLPSLPISPFPSTSINRNTLQTDWDWRWTSTRNDKTKYVEVGMDDMTWFCELVSNVHIPPLPFKGNTLPPVLTGVDNIQKYSTSCSTNSPTHPALKNAVGHHQGITQHFLLWPPESVLWCRLSRITGD